MKVEPGQYWIGEAYYWQGSVPFIRKVIRVHRAKPNSIEYLYWSSRPTDSNTLRYFYHSCDPCDTWEYQIGSLKLQLISEEKARCLLTIWGCTLEDIL